MVNTLFTVKADLNQGIKRTYLNTIFATKDAKAHQFSIEVYRGKEAVSLSGARVTATFIRADGVTVTMTGSVSGYVASVTLKDACYAKPGPFKLTIKLVSGEETSTVFYGEGSVFVSSTDSIADDGTIPNISELLAQIEEMKAATAQAKSLVATAQAENLLDNSHFAAPINQRGQAMYSGSAGYKIDRWRSTANMSWIIASGAGISLSNNGTEMTGITQYIDDTRRMPAAGEKVTLACADNAGNIYCGTVTMPSSSYIRAFRSADQSFWGNVYAEVIDGESYTPPRVQLMLSAGASIILKWVALYKGEFTADTLPPYMPKPYAQELAACQRHYFRTTGYNAFYGYTNTAASAFVYVNLPVPMRTTPTVTLTDATLTIRSNDGKTHPGITISSVSSIHGSLLRIQTTDEASSLPAQCAVVATVSEKAGVFEVSAEP